MILKIVSTKVRSFEEIRASIFRSARELLIITFFFEPMFPFVISFSMLINYSLSLFFNGIIRKTASRLEIFYRTCWSTRTLTPHFMHLGLNFLNKPPSELHVATALGWALMDVHSDQTFLYNYVPLVE